MTDKEKFEQHIFHRFINIYTDLPYGTVIKSESPDFLIKSEIGTLGIEISRIVNEKTPGERFSPSERNSVEQKIAKEAEKIFLASNHIPLHVDFGFHDSIDTRGGRIIALANQLAVLITEHVKSRSLTHHFHLNIDQSIPSELMYCGISYFPEITESVWYSAKGIFVPDLKAEQILSVISKKENKVAEYRRKADKLILLLVEGIIPESWFDGIEPVQQEVFKTNFDKILIFRNLTEEIITLK